MGKGIVTTDVCIITIYINFAKNKIEQKKSRNYFARLFLRQYNFINLGLKLYLNYGQVLDIIYKKNRNISI